MRFSTRCALSSLIVGLLLLHPGWSAAAAAAAEGVRVWTANPWASFSSDARASSAQKPVDQIALRAYQNEAIDSVLMLSNDGVQPLDVRVTTTAGLDKELPPAIDQRQIDPRAWTLRQAVMVAARDPEQNVYPAVPDALPLLDEASVIHIGAGETRQLWLTLHTRGLEAGKHEGVVRLMPLGASTTAREIPVILEVLPLALPDRPRKLDVTLWEYSPWIRTDAGPAIVDALLKYGYVTYLNLFAPHHGLAMDQSADALRSPSWSAAEMKLEALDQILSLKRRPSQENFILMNPATTFGERVAPIDADEGQALFLKYIGGVLDHIEQGGVPLERVMICPIDEVADERVAISMKLGQAIKSSHPQVRIFQTIGESATLDDLKRLSDVVDVWCVWDQRVGRAEEWKYLKSTGKPMWIYRCATYQKILSPDGYYRTLPLLAWRMQADGVGVWSFDAGTGNLWDDFDGSFGDANLVYPGQNGPVPSRRLMAFRQGIQDYMALELLADAIAQAQASSPAPPFVAQASHFLGTAIGGVLDDPASTSRARDADAKRPPTAERDRFLLLRAQAADWTLRLKNRASPATQPAQPAGSN